MTLQSVMQIERMPVRSFDDTVAVMVRYSLGALTVLLLLAAALVGWRRLAGALDSPLEPGLLLCLGVLLACIAMGLRTLWDRLALSTGGQRGRWLIRGLPSLAVLILAVSVSVSGTAPGALVVFWSLVTAEELWAWRPTVWRRRHGPHDNPVPQREFLPPAPDGALPAESAPVEATTVAMFDDMPTEDTSTALEVAVASGDAIPSSDVMQQLTRSQAVDGSEELSGWLRDRFEAGQRTSNVHVAFCPPFRSTPEVTVEHVGGPSTRIKTARVLPYGVRLDLKLAAKAEEPADVLLKFSARG